MLNIIVKIELRKINEECVKKDEETSCFTIIVCMSYFVQLRVSNF